MKKTWKQWIAIACVLSMIACMLPAMTLAEDGVSTPTDLTPVPEEPAGEEPTEEPGEETIPGSGIPELLFGIPGYKGTLKAGEDFTIVLHSDRYANILVTLALSPKNGQPADTEGVKVFFNEKAKKLVRVEKEDADSGSIDLQFEVYIAPDTDYIFVITSPFDADFTLTAVHRTEAAAEQEDGDEEEPAEEEPTEEEPAEETKDEEPVDEEPENVEKTNEEETNPEELDDITITEIIEEENTVRAWISTEDDQTGETITLKANAEPELEGVPTWYVRNEQVEEGKWKRIGYGDHVTVEAAEGDEYRFVMQDGALSEVLQLHITKDETAEETTEEAEETEENEETEETEDTEETKQPGEVNEEKEPEKETEAEDSVMEEVKEANEEKTEQQTEVETEPVEIPDDETMLEMGYYKVQVLKQNGTDLYDAIDDEENTVHLEFGQEFWVAPAEDGWAVLYSSQEDEKPQYLKWEDLLIVLQKEKEKTDTSEDAGTVSADESEEQNEIIDEDSEPLARSLTISSTLNSLSGFVDFGTPITMTVELHDFREDDVYTCKWQYSADGISFTDIDDADGLTYTYPLSAENFHYTWKFIITLSDTE